MSGAYRGEAETDARDACVIAGTARHRRACASIDVPAQPAADLALLTGYRTPAAIRRRGRSRLTAWLANRSVRSADATAATVPEAAQAQQTVLPGEDIAARIVADLTTQVLAPEERLKHESLPGMGPVLGAEFTVAAGDLHRPKRYSRRLRRVFSMSAQTSIIREGPDRDVHLKKRREGCEHVQAVTAPPVTQAA
jgi:hypothetical protein